MPHWLPDSTITFQLILLTSVFSACYSGPDPLTLETTDFRVQEGIREGYTADSDTSVFGLVSINGGGVGSCTGTLISPNTVITARHCVAPTLNQVNGGVDCSRTNFGSTYNASGLYVTNQTQLSRNPAHYHAVAEVLVPPVGDDFCGNDVALVTLVDPVPKTVAIPKIPRVDTKLMNGEKYYAVGYGATDDAGNGSGLRRRRDSLFIECVGDECPEFFVETSEWIGDTGICQGDSGGPAFDIFDRVIGVASRGSYGCDSPIYGDTYSWGTWLKESTLKAARSAGIAPPPLDPQLADRPRLLPPSGRLLRREQSM